MFSRSLQCIFRGSRVLNVTNEISSNFKCRNSVLNPIVRSNQLIIWPARHTAGMHSINSFGSPKLSQSCAGDSFFRRGIVTNDSSKDTTGKLNVAEKDAEKIDDIKDDDTKLTLFQRYKKMAKEYWYVLIPVHVATSVVWFGGFFYASKCGFDIVPYLEYFGASETVIRPFRNSSLGHVTVAWALYKIATPARYTVTLGGTTMSIKFLTKRGLIKPIPSKDNIKAMYQQKKDEYIQRKADKMK